MIDERCHFVRSQTLFLGVTEKPSMVKYSAAHTLEHRKQHSRGWAGELGAIALTDVSLLRRGALCLARGGGSLARVCACLRYGQFVEVM